MFSQMLDLKVQMEGENKDMYEMKWKTIKHSQGCYLL
nr:hypothetical protein Q903MT_gene4571 [Picea sitchensis]